MPDIPLPANAREGLSLQKVWRFLTLPFCFWRLKTYLAVSRFEDIPPERLVADGIQGVLIDADGTLGPHKTRTFTESIVRHVERMLACGLKVAIYTNASELRFEQFVNVPVVSEPYAKPDLRGFEIAMRKYLNIKDPSKVCMIGDNYLTDGGAIGAGMHFIHVEPISGCETLIHRATRKFALLCAQCYSPKAFRRARTQKNLTTN